MDKISVIVPVYKTAKYLRECVDSILAQSYENIELLLVDDGSPDSCGSICDAYAESDSRITVIHKTNGGLSSARNAGLDAAQGDYIAFVDSDDYINPDMLEQLHSSAVKYDADISICNFKKFSTDGTNFYEFDEKVTDGVMTADEAALALVSITCELYELVWNKLYRREIFKTERFDVGRLYEDGFIIHRLYSLSKRVAMTEYLGYNYRINGESITGSVWTPKKLDAITALYSRICFYYDAGRADLASKAAERYLSFLTVYIPKLMDGDLLDKKEAYEQQLRQFRSLYPRLLFSDKAQIKERLLFGLFFISPKLYFKFNKTASK